MSMLMISPFKRLFCSGIKKTSYRNNFLDLEKYSLKQSFNFKKRVGESHVLLHNGNRSLCTKSLCTKNICIYTHVQTARLAVYIL